MTSCLRRNLELKHWQTPYNLDHIGVVGAVRSLCNNLSVQTGTHLGLTSMQERTKMLHGEFSISSSIGRGTENKVKVPMQYKTAM